MRLPRKGVCIHCGEKVEQSGDYTWWSGWDRGAALASAMCNGGVHEHFAPTDARPEPLTAADAMVALERVHAKMMELIIPALEGRPQWESLLTGILDAVRANDAQFPLEDNRPDWFHQSDKGRALERSPFYPQLWLLGDGIARSELKDRVYDVLPTQIGNVVTCLAANLRGSIKWYACGYFELSMQGVDHLMDWCEREISKSLTD